MVRKGMPNMPKLRVLFNRVEGLKPEEIFPRVLSMGIETVSMFCDLGGPLPSHFEQASRSFVDVNVNLYHEAAYKGRSGWPGALRQEGREVLKALSDLGIHNYAWMIEGNLYGLPGHPLVGGFVHRDRLAEPFRVFYEIAHEVDPEANVIMVPYPHRLMNLGCGPKGWRSWFVRHGERLPFDQLAVDAHVGTWIPAVTKRGIEGRLTGTIRFLKGRGHGPYYVEVGYPTVGYKPPLGGYGWGREQDQVEVLKACYRALDRAGIPYMQICEFIDPVPEGPIYEPFFGDLGRLPRFLGVPVREEAHWGLMKRDGSEKKACEWVRQITGA